MEVIQTPIEQLIPYANNARTHSDAQIAQIAASIKEFGFNNPILIDGSRGVIAGHGRLLAARQLGLTEVPTIELAHLSETQRKAYILADNQLALNASWNPELLKIEVQSLLDVDFNVDLIGFDPLDLDNIMGVVDTNGNTDPDEVPEIPIEPKSKLGDIYQLGRHRLMCGSATDASAIAALMNGLKADMVFTDPPYGMQLDADYSGMSGNDKYRKLKGLTGGKTYKNVIGDHDDFTPDLIATIFSHFDYCDEIFIWGVDYFAELIQNRNDGAIIVWDKRGNESRDKMIGSCFELCWSKHRHKRLIARIDWAGPFGVEKEPERKRCHPTQKPVRLFKWFYENWGRDKKHIVDLYGGSGSTLIACEQLQLNAYVMELEPLYVDVIIARWENFTGKEAQLINA